MVHTIFTVIHVLVSLGLIATVLLQSGRSAGLSGAIAGGAEQLFGKKKGRDDLFARGSSILAVLFFISSLALSIITLKLQ